MDVKLTSGSTTKTLPLVRENGVTLWRHYEADSTRPTSEPVFSQTDWSGGMGQGNFQDPTRYSVGSSIDTSQVGQICLPPLVNTTTGSSERALSYASFKNGWYCASPTNAVYVLTVGPGTWSTKLAASGTNTYEQLCVHNGYMFVARGASTAYAYTADGLSFTTSTTVDGDSSSVGDNASGFVSAPPFSGTTPVLWKFIKPNTVYSSQFGTNSGTVHTEGTSDGTWTSAYRIGDSSADILNIFTHSGELFIGKEDGLYHLDPDGLVHKTLSLASNSLNFYQVAHYRGSTYFTLRNSVVELTTYNSVDVIGPFEESSDISQSDRVCYGLVGTNDALYVLYYDGTNSVIYKGVYKERWAWHPIATLTGAYYKLGVFVRATVNEYYPKLWVSKEGSAPYYLQLAQNPLATTSLYTDTLAFAATGYIETGWIDLGHRDWYKIIDSVLAECRGTLAAGRTVAVSYYVDEGSLTTIDTTYVADTAGTKNYLDAVAAGKKVKFRITLASNNTAYTPIVKYFAAYGSVRPTRQELFDFTVMCETGHTAKAKDLRDFLFTARDATALLTLTDRYGVSHYVRIVPGYPIETEYMDEYSKQPAMGLRVVCEKVDWS